MPLSDIQTKKPSGEPTKIPQKRINKKSQTAVNVIALKYLAVALSEKPRTQPEIMEVSGLANSTVSRYLRILHQKPNVVYIADWRRIGTRGNWSAVWAWGYKAYDVPKPKPLTSGEYNKRWRKKKLHESLVKQTETGVIHVSGNRESKPKPRTS
jgi:transcription initiation factor TFIIIB Brf1 subunit/transcription initiation factor TFIIB